MAAVAFSTPARVAQQGPVTRAIAAMRGGEGQDEHRGLGCVILDEPVFFDAGRYPAAGDPILVVFGDGRLAVVSMPWLGEDPHQALNPSFLMVEVEGPKVRGIRIARERAALIGAVRR